MKEKYLHPNQQVEILGSGYPHLCQLEQVWRAD